MTAQFGAIVKEWRAIRRVSQLDLSLRAALSARHLSFLESGRAAPSRMMVLRLAEALEMPKPVVNRALAAAGFSGAYPTAAEDAPDMRWARRARERLLDNHGPYPGVAVDRQWNVVAANNGALRLFSIAGDAPAANMIELLLALGETSVVANWEEIAALALTRLRAEIAHLGGDAVLERFAARLSTHPRLPPHVAPPRDRVMIPMLINVEGARLSVFSVIGQFGSAQEIALSELKVELMFPADAETEAWFAASDTGR
ncbi:MAG: helix-turn-helix transcriptional regulator [Parvularculaceae bacterium]|nr:helix-turn-helix transcriptional regulator [Parvularculaceae bacterium]